MRNTLKRFQFMLNRVFAGFRFAQTRKAMRSVAGKTGNALRAKAVAVCTEKIARKGETVGLSFYAFFANKNDDPELLMEAAEWWIRTHKLDPFEKAVKIREMIRSGV